MWISKRKWEAMNARITGLESKIQSQRPSVICGDYYTIYENVKSYING